MLQEEKSPEQANPRKGSVTPSTFKQYRSIKAEVGQAKQELDHAGRAINLLQKKQAEFQHTSGAMAKSFEQITAGVIDQDRFVRSTKEFEDFNKEFSDKTARIVDYTKQATAYQEFLRDKDVVLYAQVIYANSSHEVHRFGIDVGELSAQDAGELVAIHDKTLAIKGASTKGSRASKKNMDLPHMLHPMEVVLVKDAIGYLKGGHKTVLVDIFER